MVLLGCLKVQQLSTLSLFSLIFLNFILSLSEEDLIEMTTKPPSRLLHKDKPTSQHPQHEKNSQIYSDLLGRMVLLEAEPQIGKTGAVTAFIDIMRQRMFEVFLFLLLYLPSLN